MGMNFNERRAAAAARIMKENEGLAAVNPATGAPVDENRLPASIIVNPVEMEGTFKTKLITSPKLCAMINKVIRTISPDYDGSRITLVGHVVMCELFFAENSLAPIREPQIKVIECRLGATGRDTDTLIDRYNSSNKTSTMYQLTQSGKEALAEFLPNNLIVNREKGVYDWARAVGEEVEQSNYGGQNKIIVKVQFDLNKFLRKVYGKKAGDGSHYIYEVNAIRPLDAVKLQNGNIIATKWQLAIMQMDEQNVKAAFEESGLNPLQNTLNIIRQ